MGLVHYTSPRRQAEPAWSTRKKALAAVVFFVLLLAVCVGMFFVFRAALAGLNGPESGAGSPNYATDAYVVYAQVDGEELTAVYIGYMDSINSRNELCRLEPNTASSFTAGAQVQTLEQIWQDGGVDALVSSLEQLGNFEAAGALTLNASQMEQLISLATDPDTPDSPTSLAQELLQSQTGECALDITATLGLLRAMQQTGAEGYTLMQAPASNADAVCWLDRENWLIMLGGMRDPADKIQI